MLNIFPFRASLFRASLVQSPKHELDAAQERVQLSRRLAYVELQKFIVQLVLHFLHAFHYGESRFVKATFPGLIKPIHSRVNVLELTL